jgi:hypothetical protein
VAGITLSNRAVRQGHYSEASIWVMQSAAAHGRTIQAGHAVRRGSSAKHDRL